MFLIPRNKNGHLIGDNAPLDDETFRKGDSYYDPYANVLWICIPCDRNMDRRLQILTLLQDRMNNSPLFNNETRYSIRFTSKKKLAKNDRKLLVTTYAQWFEQDEKTRGSRPQDFSYFQSHLTTPTLQGLSKFFVS